MCNGFAGNPSNLWITLLISLVDARSSLENQGFRQLAQKSGKKIIPYKSTT
jgi:hypothetical protein